MWLGRVGNIMKLHSVRHDDVVVDFDDNHNHNHKTRHTSNHLAITHALLHTHVPAILVIPIPIRATVCLLTFVRPCDRLARGGRVVAILLQPGHRLGSCVVTRCFLGREELVTAAKGDAVDAGIRV